MEYVICALILNFHAAWAFHNGRDAVGVVARIVCFVMLAFGFWSLL